LVFTPVQTHILPLWQIPLHAVRGSVALGPKPLDKGLGILEVREAHELAPQFDAPVLAMNATASLWGTVDGIAAVLLVEQCVQGVFVAGDRIGVMQRQSCPFDRFNGLCDRRGGVLLPSRSRQRLPLLALLWQTMRVPALPTLHGSFSFSL